MQGLNFVSFEARYIMGTFLLVPFSLISRYCCCGTYFFCRNIVAVHGIFSFSLPSRINVSMTMVEFCFFSSRIAHNARKDLLIYEINEMCKLIGVACSPT